MTSNIVSSRWNFKSKSEQRQGRERERESANGESVGQEVARIEWPIEEEQKRREEILSLSFSIVFIRLSIVLWLCLPLAHPLTLACYG